MTHPIFQKELDALEKDFRAYLIASIQYAQVQEPYRPLSSEDEITWLKSFLLASLRRASLAVVEEKIQEVGNICHLTAIRESDEYDDGRKSMQLEVLEILKSTTLATAREITGIKE